MIVTSVKDPLKDLIPFKSKGGERVVCVDGLAEQSLVLDASLDRLRDYMESLIEEFKSNFSRPWEFHLHRHHAFGRSSVLWRRKGLRGKGQSSVCFDADEFVIYRSGFSDAVQYRYLELERKRLELNHRFAILHYVCKLNRKLVRDVQANNLAFDNLR